jgi:hypothetical protein
MYVLQAIVVPDMNWLENPVSGLPSGFSIQCCTFFPKHLLLLQQDQALIL